MLTVDKFSRTPIYEQLEKGLEKQIISGVLPAGTRLPSVRELSVSLCINPNTVQKALAALDSAGIIISAPGRGSFVAEDAKEKITARYANGLGELTALITELVRLGVDEATIRATVDSTLNQHKKEESTL